MTLNEKTINFLTVIKNAYRDEENQVPVEQMKLNDDNLTEDFTAMAYALNVFFNQVTGQGIDIVDFTHLFNKLVVQNLLEEMETREDER